MIDSTATKQDGMVLIPYADVTSAQGAAALTSFMLGGSVGAIDAAKTAQEAVKAKTDIEKANKALGITANVVGFGAGSAEMFQKFASNSSEAGALANKLGVGAAIVSVYGASDPIWKLVVDGKFGEIKASDLDALAGATLAAGALFVGPQVAIALGILSAGMTIAGWSKQANSTTLASALTSVQKITNDLYTKLAPTDQAAFKTSLQDSMKGTLEGGIMVPKLNADGLINGYGVEVPTNTLLQSDGSMIYQFASGAILRQGVSTPMSSGTIVGQYGKTDVWTVPDKGYVTQLVVTDNGTFSNVFRDASGASVGQTTLLFRTGTTRYPVTTTALSRQPEPITK